MLNQDQTPEEGTDKDKIGDESLNESSNEGGDTKETSQEPSKSVDYKKKFAESTRENQILADKIRQTEDKLGKVTKNEIPTEEELKTLHPDWEEMTDLERDSVKKNLILERRLGGIEQEVRGLKEERLWETKINNFLDKAKLTDEYPALVKREKEFMAFAKKPTHKGVSVEVLARAFLFSPKEDNTPVVHKGSVLERGSGAEKITPTSKKLTAKELGNLRENDPKKYKEIITSHPEMLPDDVE